VVIPTKEVAEAFETVVSSIQQKITANQDHAKTLTQLRNTLLPRLISGQMRFPEMEATVENAVFEAI
jgi:type I restriction enzyme S subunit